MTVKDYKELEVWKMGVEITEQIYALTDSFPDHELYCLSQQMRRSAVSISSNIAEGFMRKNTKEYIQFLYISLGSCAELDTQIIFSRKLKYCDEHMYEQILELLNHEMRKIRKLIQKLYGS